MTTSNTFANGQTLVSSALTTDQIEALFQSLVCQILGVTIFQPYTANVTINSNQVTLSDASGVSVGWMFSDGNPVTNTPFTLFPEETTITAINGNVLTLSENATATLANASLFATDSAANTACRITWNTDGAPAWSVGQDVVSVQIVEEDNPYNRIRNRWNTENDDVSVTQNDQYTRCWEVTFICRGPGSFDSVRLIKSALLQDFTHDILAASQVYLVPDLPAPVRSPELFEGQWWQITTLKCSFYEQVNETINIPSVATVPVITETGIEIITANIDVQVGFGIGSFGQIGFGL